MLMSAAASIPPNSQPDPNPAATDKPSRAGRLLDLVRKLIDYAKELAVTFQQRGTTDPSPHTYRFRTSDIRQILACIARGLQRAQALEARIVHGAARQDAERPPRTPAAPSVRKPRAAQPTPRDNAEAPSPLADLPTPEQIAAEVRRRPVGAVVADICRDLGILPSHPLWRELQHAIIRYGGSLARLVEDLLDRSFPIRAGNLLAGTAPASPGQLHPSPTPACTGPPRKL
jgi:hypothetical protein